MKTANKDHAFEQNSVSIMVPIAAGKDRVKWMVSSFRPDPSIKSWRIVMDCGEGGDLISYWECSLDVDGKELMGGGIGQSDAQDQMTAPRATQPLRHPPSTAGQMSKKQEAIRPKSSAYGIEMRDPEIAQALADLIEMGLVVDSGQRRFQNGRWQIVWVAVPPEERGKHYIARRKI